MRRHWVCHGAIREVAEVRHMSMRRCKMSMLDIDEQLTALQEA